MSKTLILIIYIVFTLLLLLISLRDMVTLGEQLIAQMLALKWYYEAIK